MSLVGDFAMLPVAEAIIWLPPPRLCLGEKLICAIDIRSVTDSRLSPVNLLMLPAFILKSWLSIVSWCSSYVNLADLRRSPEVNFEVNWEGGLVGGLTSSKVALPGSYLMKPWVLVLVHKGPQVFPLAILRGGVLPQLLLQESLWETSTSPVIHKKQKTIAVKIE